LPSERTRSHLQDILEAIEAVERFAAGMDFASFASDEKTTAAVERKLLLLSEAARRLGEDAETLCPGVPWKNVRGIGNWIRHQYDKIDPAVVWETVKKDLPALKSAVQTALASNQFD
jgi:uncharacterized protein with HEPN domain